MRHTAWALGRGKKEVDHGAGKLQMEEGVLLCFGLDVSLNGGR